MLMIKWVVWVWAWVRLWTIVWGARKMKAQVWRPEASIKTCYKVTPEGCWYWNSQLVGPCNSPRKMTSHSAWRQTNCTKNIFRSLRPTNYRRHNQGSHACPTCGMMFNNVRVVLKQRKIMQKKTSYWFSEMNDCMEWDDIA